MAAVTLSFPCVSVKGTSDSVHCCTARSTGTISSRYATSFPKFTHSIAVGNHDILHLKKEKCSATSVCMAGYRYDDEDEWEEESPEEIAAAYEKLYGKPFGAVRASKKSDFGGDSKDNGADEEGGRRGSDSYDERVIQVRRVTKVVKGGKQLSFRAVVVVGDRNGIVGVGVGKAKEVIIAVQKAVVDAKRHRVFVPMTKYKTFPHRLNGIFGAAEVMLRPAAVGTGVIAGGAVRVVLELAGLENALGKELGSGNPLNNARATLDAVSNMRQFKDVAEERGIPMEELWK